MNSGVDGRTGSFPVNETSNDLVVELAGLLGVRSIDPNTLKLCIKLLDEGVNPEMLATSITRIKKEASLVI